MSCPSTHHVVLGHGFWALIVRRCCLGSFKKCRWLVLSPEIPRALDWGSPSPLRGSDVQPGRRSRVFAEGKTCFVNHRDNDLCLMGSRPRSCCLGGLVIAVQLKGSWATALWVSVWEVASKKGLWIIKTQPSSHGRGVLISYRLGAEPCIPPCSNFTGRKGLGFYKTDLFLFTFFLSVFFLYFLPQLWLMFS